MAGITLAKAIEVFQREVASLSPDVVKDVITTSLEFMLINGGGQILREWKVLAKQGKFTFPRDLESPVKYKLSNDASWGFGTFASPYHSYSSSSIKSCCGYADWNIETKANRVFTQYDLPKSGVYLYYTTRSQQDASVKNCDGIYEGPSIIVNGKMNGKEIAPTHNNFKTSGEVLTLYHEDDPNKNHSSFCINEITGIYRDPTCDWAMLTGICPNSGKQYFLSHYHPDETTPAYQQGQIIGCGPEVCLHVLGRINPSIEYTREEEILPIASFEILRLLAIRARYEEGKDLKLIAAMEQRIKNTIQKYRAYQQKPKRGVSMRLGASGASLANI